MTLQEYEDSITIDDIREVLIEAAEELADEEEQ